MICPLKFKICYQSSGYRINHNKMYFSNVNFGINVKNKMFCMLCVNMLTRLLYIRNPNFF